jgi:hypothetical protein
MLNKMTYKLFIIIWIGILPFICISQLAVTAGTVRLDPTFENISVHYSIVGDTNHNSTLDISYRISGSGSAYQPAAMTMRAYPGLVIDGAATTRNFHAGSAMFLTPNTTYQIRLVLSDPDGGSVTTTRTVSTKAIPQPSSSAQVKYVVPGNGGGTGSSANPFQGIQAAVATAQAGDHFILRSGEYEPFSMTTNGTANQPIVFESEIPHTAVINGNGIATGIIILGSTNIPVQHIIIDGLIITDGSIGIDAQSTQFLTVRNCLISNVTFGVYNRRENGLERDQYITNNYFVGRTTWPQTGIPGDRAIDLRGNNNVVSHNNIRNFADGVSTDGPPYETSYSMDIHHNDIINMVDDIIEVDGTISNTRIYNNRGFNARAGISVAPVFGGPVYILRNELFNLGISGLKMNRGPSGLVVVHNTISNLENAMSSPGGWQNTFFRNNVIFASRYCFEEFDLVSGSNDDWDYGAYKSTRGGMTNTEEFKWDNLRYATVPILKASGVLEANAVQVEFSDFNNISLPIAKTISYDPSERDFMPVAGSPAINSGDNIEHLNTPYVMDGQADRGALEFGMPVPDYGPDYALPKIPTEESLSLEVVRIDETFEHISVNVAIDGDDNLNSTMSLFYKAQGASTYLPAAKSMRAHPGLLIDGATWGYNFHAASAMFLQPGTTYDLQIVLTDSDGGSQTIQRTGTTKAIPQPSFTRIRYVASGNGGGTGTFTNPYLGLQAAADSAQPGDHFIVRPGVYGQVDITVNGTAAQPISFISETQHAAAIDGAGTSGGVIVLGRFDNNPTAHIIIDGFRIRDGQYGIDGQHTQFVTVRNNIFTNVGFGFVNRREDGLERDQYITNNEMIGNTSWPQVGIPGERGVDIRGNNNVVSCNTIENFGDAISTDGPPYELSYSLDIHNNEMKNIVDDHIEVDGTISNTRVYRNRGYNGRAGISLAPIFGGPVYVFRNELFNMENSAFKMNRSPSGLIIAHNTVASVENAVSSPGGWQNTFFRNNVIFAGRYCFEEFGLVAASLFDDWDYGAYKSTRGGMTNTEEFKWDDVRYATVPVLQASGVLEANSIQVEFSDFGNIALPVSFTTSYSPPQRDFSPTTSSAVIDNGDQLDNMNVGSVFDNAPDRGALEFGQPLPKYGANFGNTCIDGILNGDEEYVDCGGSCPVCDDCPYPTRYVIEQPIPSNLDLQLDQWIISNGTVIPNSDVSFKAAIFIEFTEGFEVSPGAIFLADIDGCN